MSHRYEYRVIWLNTCSFIGGKKWEWDGNIFYNKKKAIKYYRITLDYKQAIQFRLRGSNSGWRFLKRCDYDK